MEKYSENNSVLFIEGSETKLEDIGDFKNSYFHDQYQQAFWAVKGIVKQTLRLGRGGETGDYQIYNIVPFMGGRGSGKTSAMMSFINALEKYYDNRKNEECYYSLYDYVGSGKREPNVRFTCIGQICGQLLEKGEDIFKVILAQMYGKFLGFDQNRIPKDKKYENEKRELQLLFDNIYRNVSQLEHSDYKDLVYEESSITSLINLSSSLKVKAEFKKLIQQYLKFFWQDQDYYDSGNRGIKNFLVVAIDDLDLNIEHGYEMLEKIHRYMMVDNIIVLLSADYDQLKLLCEKSFYNMVPSFDSKLKEKNEYVERLAQDFLDKVLPANMRVHMPLLIREDNVMVKLHSDAEDRLPKEAIFKLIYEKLGMRMDFDGAKRHFYEQNSLRALVNFVLLFCDMNNLVDGGEYRFQIFKQNYKILMLDTLTRMADARLNFALKEIFNKITGSGLPHSCRNLYIEVLNFDLWGGADREDQLFRSLQNNIEYYGYSYGEIMRIIYCWGRISRESKEFVRCLLAFYSLEFMKVFYEYCSLEEQEDKKDEAEKKKECLINTVNGSVAGSWANKMFPKVMAKHKIFPGESIGDLGVRKNVEMDKAFSFELALTTWKKAEQLINSGSLKKKEDKSFISKIFRSVLVLGMFFEQPHYRTEASFQWKLEEAKNENNDFKKELYMTDDKLTTFVTKVRIRNTSGKSTFNILNFVSNALQYEDNMKSLMKSLYCLLSGNSDKDIPKNIQRVIGIDEEFRSWRNYSKGFALPIYDVDVTYNLLKRLRQRNVKGRVIGQDSVFEELKKIYEFITAKLESNDKKYGDLSVGLKECTQSDSIIGHEVKFSEAFIKCPFINWFLHPKEHLIDEFSEMFDSFIGNVLQTGKALSGTSGEPEFSGIDD